MSSRAAVAHRGRRGRRAPQGGFAMDRFSVAPVGILPDAPDMAAWSVLREEDEGSCSMPEAGQSTCIAPKQRDIATISPPAIRRFWVVLSPAEGKWPYALAAVTADPAEGEAFTEAGANLVETVAMPEVVRRRLKALSPSTTSSGSSSSASATAPTRKRWRAVSPKADTNERRGIPGRWSRRKQEAKAAEQAPAAFACRPQNRAPRRRLRPSRFSPEIDLSKLPPLDSITAATDITEFPAQGHSAELCRAALRRAWAADPAIRDFVGLAENAWDFNDPERHSWLRCAARHAGTDRRHGRPRDRRRARRRRELASELPEKPTRSVRKRAGRAS